MKLYSHKKLHGHAKDIYFEHNPSDGRKVKPCYHYEIAESSRWVEALRMGAEPVDVTVKGMGCGRDT